MSGNNTEQKLTDMLDVSAFLALVAEHEAAGGVAANLSAGHPAAAERFGDNHVLVHTAVCDQTQKNTAYSSQPAAHCEEKPAERTPPDF